MDNTTAMTQGGGFLSVILRGVLVTLFLVMLLVARLLVRSIINNFRGLNTIVDQKKPSLEQYHTFADSSKGLIICPGVMFVVVLLVLLVGSIVDAVSFHP